MIAVEEFETYEAYTNVNSSRVLLNEQLNFKSIPSMILPCTGFVR